MAVLLAAGNLPVRGFDLTLRAFRPNDAKEDAGVGVLRCWPSGIRPDDAALAVLTPDGRALGLRVVWWREGDPLDLRFDASGVRNVVLRIVSKDFAKGWPVAPEWEDRGGVVLETRRRTGDAVDTWPDVKAQWDAAGEPLGRSEVRGIFDGIHRHGPTADFLSHYQGWFVVPKTGNYGFATVSDDASFLRIDGKLVAEWPGWHGIEGGRHGQHHGTVDLTPGLHRIDYDNVQDASGFLVGAAWRLPGSESFETMPAAAFAPTARFEVGKVEGPDAGAAFRWGPGRHVRTDRSMLLEMRFRAEAAPSDAVCRWTFPDGVVREGPEVAHVFCGEAVAPVTLEILRAGNPLGRRTHGVRIKPNWSQTAEFDEGVCAELAASLSAAELRQLRFGALVAWLRWADEVEDRALLTRLAEVALPKVPQFAAAEADVLYRLGFHLQEPGLRRYAEVRTVWSAVRNLPDVPPELRGRTALHGGGMELHAFGNVVEAGRLLAEADRWLPAGDDRRLLEIYRGDAAALAGRLPEARDSYARAGTVVSADNVHYEVRRVERMERARRFLAAGEQDAAEQVVRELEWERPMERMGLETGLVLARAQQARGEKELALWTVRRLRNVGTGAPLRPELLWFAAGLLREAGAGTEGDAAVAELLRDFPYSEAAARARHTARE